MSDNMRQGTIANITGNTLEQIVLQTLIPKGFTVVSYTAFVKGGVGSELIIRNAPYQTIYGHPGKTEFLVLSAKYNLEVRIECKWQQSPGSVDEKFPYLYLNCIEAMPEKHIMIIVDGGGAKAGAVQWLKDTAKRERYRSDASGKTIEVLSLAEFVAWAHRILR